jgi:hypothetical protein
VARTLVVRPRAYFHLLDREAVAGANKVMERFRNIPFRTTSGAHQIIVTAVERSRVLSDENIGGAGSGGGRGGGGGLGQANVEIAGPYGEVSIGSSPSRDRIFVCYPRSLAEEKPCAEQIARHIATRAYRRPASDADVAKLMAFFESGRREIGHFDGGVQEIVMGTISSPDFLYRVIAPRGDGHGVQPLSGLELASRLAFFLWSDVPDDELRRLAVEGQLEDAKVYQQQVARMLKDRSGPVARLTPAITRAPLDQNALAADPEYLPELARIMAAAMANSK